MEEAVNVVQKMSADLGGTEILRPLTHIYNQSCIPNQPRQVTAKTGWVLAFQWKVWLVVNTLFHFITWFSFPRIFIAISSCLSLLMERWATPKKLSTWSGKIQAPTGEVVNIWNAPERHTKCSDCVCVVLCSRCFSFGIGEGASSALINGLAKEGRGHAQFITGTDRMQPKVRPLLKTKAPDSWRFWVHCTNRKYNASPDFIFSAF